MDKIKILVVDDEPDICEVLRFNLENEDFVVTVAHSAEEALNIISEDDSLILLDVMMGGMSGFRLAEKLRKQGNNTPIIFLTAKDTENDMLTGFSIGADDYIAKPFSIKEVIARVKAILKRSQVERQATVTLLECGGMQLNLETKQFKLKDMPVALTKKEFEILYLLMKYPERVFTRQEILDRVWKDDGYVLERTVDVHITRLRKKMGAFGSSINNRSGYGYCFYPSMLE